MVSFLFMKTEKIENILRNAGFALTVPFALFFCFKAIQATYIMLPPLCISFYEWYSSSFRSEPLMTSICTLLIVGFQLIIIAERLHTTRVNKIVEEGRENG